MTDTLEADGSTDTMNWQGGTGTMFAQGTFGSGTLTLEFSIDGGSTWTAVTGSEFAITAAGSASFTLGPCSLRATLASSTSPSITVAIRGTGIGHQ